MNEAKHQLQRLQVFVFDFSLNIIVGTGGRLKYRENAVASAGIVNEIKPHLIFIAMLHLEEECTLSDKLEQGLFAENTLREIIEEEIFFLKHLQLETPGFFSLHLSNSIRLDGQLP